MANVRDAAVEVDISPRKAADLAATQAHGDGKEIRALAVRLRVDRFDELVRGSSYLDVIETHPDWVGAPFIEEAEYLRDTNEKAWRWEYLGEITGTDGAVFDNVHDVRVTDGRIRGIERIRNGVDWGWFTDPWRFVRCGWEPGARRLLILCFLVLLV